MPLSTDLIQSSVSKGLLESFSQGEESFWMAKSFCSAPEFCSVGQNLITTGHEFQNRQKIACPDGFCENWMWKCWYLFTFLKMTGSEILLYHSLSHCVLGQDLIVWIWFERVVSMRALSKPLMIKNTTLCCACLLLLACKRCLVVSRLFFLISYSLIIVLNDTNLQHDGFEFFEGFRTNAQLGLAM